MGLRALLPDKAPLPLTEAEQRTRPGQRHVTKSEAIMEALGEVRDLMLIFRISGFRER